ncbi:MAG TPA: sigma-54 dependent transcriptional regulator [Verrucomicrobiae bacterium]|nr:sigma-54 dependent transcriptional regulator [Verrucomicrobiae bacterium]
MARTKVLIIDDEKLVRWSLQQKLSKGGYEVESAPTGEEGLTLIREDGYDLVLLDLRLPGMDGVNVLQEIRKLEKEVGVIMLTAETSISRAVECVRLGAHNYLCKPFDFEEVRVALEKAREDLKLRREVTRIRRAQRRKFGLENLVGQSPQMRQVRELIARVGESDATTVLIEGENGTGKELAARAIHLSSARANQAFLGINCSAIPEALIESELFGHERGAFTDAKSTKKGLFELADGGTVLLDEVGDMKPAVQAKLLRVLESREFQRVGGTQSISVDVRVIAATNKNLEQAVVDGEFRQDLYYRLKVISLRMPSLRDQADDIPVLAAHYLAQFAEEFSRPPKTLSAEAAKALRQYGWPGNVRELRNVMERLVILERTEFILPEHLPTELRLGTKPVNRSIIQLPPGGVALVEVERELVSQAMERTGGNQSSAAELLGIERDALRRRLIKYGYLAATTGEVSAVKC